MSNGTGLSYAASGDALAEPLTTTTEVTVVEGNSINAIPMAWRSKTV